MKGFFKKILKVDLNKEQYGYEDIPEDVLKTTLGGKGLGTYLLMKENPKGVSPQSPDNIFIIATGPVTGTRMWSQSRFGAFAKSPATGGFGESYCGGSVAPKIKGCGIDAVVLVGGCQSLKYLVITEDEVAFHDASEIKGAETHVAEDHILRNSPKGAGALVIGPAGENKVAIACIKSDRWRSLGRGGLGAVLGAKNVKGLAFFGGKTCPIENESLLRSVIKRIADRGKESPVTSNYRNLGTPMQVKVMNAHKGFPTRYWYKSYFEKWENISADYMQSHFEVTPQACPNCFLQCTKLSKIKNGRHKGLILEGPEFETIYAIGGLNEIDSLEEVAYLNDVCDKLGLDTMSAGNLSAFAIEAYKAGKSDYAIDYNMPDKVAGLYNMIARREGFGDILAGGIKKASKELGLEDMAIHVKGLEPAGFDPRVLKGMALSYATAARGACHLRGTFYKAELSGQMDKDQIEGKARLHIDYEDRAAIFDSLVLCRFFRDFILWDDLLEIVEATSGLAMTKVELEDLANGITNLSRDYNRREGLDSSTDCLPNRFHAEPTPEGKKISKEELEIMIQEYNHIRERK